MKRERIDTNGLNIRTGLNEPFCNIPAMKMYVTLNDYNEPIKRNLSGSDKERFGDYTFIPVDVRFNPNDMTIEATFVPAV